MCVKLLLAGFRVPKWSDWGERHGRLSREGSGRTLREPTALDGAGDRLNADFDFWAVRPTNGSYGWVRIGTYTSGTLTLF